MLQQTIIYFTPIVNASKACSLVWPSFDHPASNSPFGAAIIRIAASDYDVPVIIFFIKSLWPGASIIVNTDFSDSNFHNAISIVKPLSLSV